MSEITAEGSIVRRSPASVVRGLGVLLLALRGGTLDLCRFSVHIRECCAGVPTSSVRCHHGPNLPRKKGQCAAVNQYGFLSGRCEVDLILSRRQALITARCLKSQTAEGRGH